MSDKTQYEASESTAFHMRKSQVLKKIADGKVARVIKLNLTDPKIAEVFAFSKPDALWICMEHVGTTFTEAENLIRACKVHDVDTVLRVARGSYSDYVRGLELDATGLIVPHVMGVNDATNVRNITKFAPMGKRAVDGGNADGCFTRVALHDYLAEANTERFICHQIEDPEAVDQIDDMAQIDGVDSLFFGPGDYSVALGIPGDIFHPDVDKVRRKVARAARDAGKIAATVCPMDRIREHVDMGYNLLSVGADVVALGQYADKLMAAFEDM